MQNSQPRSKVESQWVEGSQEVKEQVGEGQCATPWEMVEGEEQGQTVEVVGGSQ